MVGFSVAAGLLVYPLQTRADEFTWHSPFEPCSGDCAVTFLSGQLVETGMTNIFINKHIPPWDWRWGTSYLESASLSRQVLTFSSYVGVETEIGAGKRFGFLHETEAWGALYFRLKLPGAEYLRTSIAVSTGLNYATDVPVFEQIRTKGPGDRLLHYLSPEITLGLPSQPNLDLVIRFHHRSGGQLSVFNHTGGGAQYGTAGIRYHF